MVISLEAGQRLLAMQKSVYEVTKPGMTSKQRTEAETGISYLTEQIRKFDEYSEYGSYNEAMQEIDDEEY